MKFNAGQIVKGVKAGTFVVLGYRIIAGETLVQLKEVNPANHSQMARGELALPETALIAA